ncbi:hypothetical protein Tco_0894388 [Tanacetum coccineum]|uniref:Reverse transcriptase domain-containing protein n=1 Tax=Tanacetum coccineum TaxID=301880 RepID=A0ABQ5CEW2_9ASTR
MNGKPHPFNGMEGVVGLRRWIEKVEQVFEICKCAEEDKVMFAASTFEGHALTWWNGNVHHHGLFNANHILGLKRCTQTHGVGKGKEQQNEGGGRAHARAFVVVENPQTDRMWVLRCRPPLTTNTSRVSRWKIVSTLLRSFDVIVGMDWLSYHRAVIGFVYEKDCPYSPPNGDDYSEITVRDGTGSEITFVISDDLTGHLPLLKEIEIRIDLIPGSVAVCKVLLRHRTFGNEELSKSIKRSYNEKGFIRPESFTMGL